ncbi:MAG: cation diffusion facilitator family transporter [Polyangiaceae bacterium]
MSAANSKKVVIAALSGNLAIAVCKFTAAFLSGSTATLAEAVHSLADSGNQLLLLIGIGLAIRPASEKFPFGRAAERYFWPFVVALMLFSVGGAFAIIEGIVHLLHGGGGSPAGEVLQFSVFGHAVSFRASYLNYGVLGTSFLFEALSFRVAFREFKVLSKGQPLRKALLEARDPTIPLVLAEDSTALVGLGIALAAVVLSGATGNEWWDPLGSLIIGILLCFVAVVLARVTHGLLIGESATIEDQAHVLRVVEQVDGVDRVTQLLTMHLGPDEIVLALKIAFRPDIKLRELEETTNLIEAKLRAVMPQMRKIFIEPDSKGDGRGLKSARALSEIDEASL